VDQGKESCYRGTQRYLWKDIEASTGTKWGSKIWIDGASGSISHWHSMTCCCTCSFPCTDQGAGLSQTAPNCLNRLSRVTTFLTALSWQFSIGCWSSTSCSMPSSAQNWSSIICKSNTSWSLVDFITGLGAHFQVERDLQSFQMLSHISIKDILGRGRSLKLKYIKTCTVFGQNKSVFSFQ